MLRYRLARNKSNFEIDFLFVVYLNKRQIIKKKIKINGNVIRPAPLK